MKAAWCIDAKRSMLECHAAICTTSLMLAAPHKLVRPCCSCLQRQPIVRAPSLYRTCPGCTSRCCLQASKFCQTQCSQHAAQSPCKFIACMCPKVKHTTMHSFERNCRMPSCSAGSVHRGHSLAASASWPSSDHRGTGSEPRCR